MRLNTLIRGDTVQYQHSIHLFRQVLVPQSLRLRDNSSEDPTFSPAALSSITPSKIPLETISENPTFDPSEIPSSIGTTESEQEVCL